MQENVLAERIRRTRKLKGISQAALAATVGVSQGAVSQWEQGIAEPKSRQIALLSDALDVSADYLLGRTEAPITIAAHQTENMASVTPERMEEIITQAYELIMAKKRNQ